MLLNKKRIIFIDFNQTYCTTSIQILNSKYFKRVLNYYITYLNRQGFYWWKELQSLNQPNKKIADEITNLFKLLLVFHQDEISHPLLSKVNCLVRFINAFYDYWRQFERYATLLQMNGEEKGVSTVHFVDSFADFEKLVLLTYRRLGERIQGYKHLVYRQLAAGCDCGILLKEEKLFLPSKYQCLSKIPLIGSIIINPPFIAYTASSTRSGVFQEISFHPLEHATFAKKDWFCYPLKVGRHLAFVYFHKQYTNIGLSLANLFEPARFEEYAQRKPDLIYIHGGSNLDIEKPCFYVDKEEGMYLGYSPYSEEITYFGYMKKMLLTLDNLKRIDHGELPIHGAMVNIEFMNGTSKNVIFMGDSGAGKSETIEALRQIGYEQIKAMNIIFDDMGSLEVKNGEVYAYGSEIGAFVRLDDLDIGYAYKKIDRAIFLNPDKDNARTIIPTTLYEDIIKPYHVDLFLYANNYEEKVGIELFEDFEVAKQAFTQGKRRALKTTSESGLVSTFFANPFGPLQRKESTMKLIDHYFALFEKNQIPLGAIYTHLGLVHQSGEEIKKAAISLLNYLQK